jgi:hypothetical protein
LGNLGKEKRRIKFHREFIEKYQQKPPGRFKLFQCVLPVQQPGENTLIKINCEKSLRMDVVYSKFLPRTGLKPERQLCEESFGIFLLYVRPGPVLASKATTKAISQKGERKKERKKERIVADRAC